MSSGKHWLPGPDADFARFFRKYHQGVLKYTAGADPVWTHIPTARVTGLSAALTGWDAAFAKLDGPHIPADVKAKNEEREESEDVLRAFNRQYVLYAKEVTDAQRVEIGCPVHDTTPSVIPRPNAIAEADIAYIAKHLLKLVNIRPVTGTMSEEEAEYEFGVRIFWGIMGPPVPHDKFRLSSPPETGSDLPHSIFTHRKNCRFDFEGDSGATVYFCIHYENGKGEAGPFGPIFSAIIP
jgi:hypothetical protein